IEAATGRGGTGQNSAEHCLMPAGDFQGQNTIDRRGARVGVKGHGGNLAIVGPTGNPAIAARSYDHIFEAGTDGAHDRLDRKAVGSRSKKQHMIAPLAKFLDWSAIQLMTLMMPAIEHKPRLEEAVQFLNGPDFVPVYSQLAQVEFKDSLHF